MDLIGIRYRDVVRVVIRVVCAIKAKIIDTCGT